MPRDPYDRRSVWIDILGIVLIGAVLLGGAAYLLTHAGDSTRNVSTGFSQEQRYTVHLVSHTRPVGVGCRGGRLICS
jgi:hypothetical protein